MTRCTARSRPWLGSARCGPDPSTPDGSVAGICVPHPLLEGQTFCFTLLPKDVHKETSGGFVIAGAAPPSTSVPSTRHERNAAIADVQLRLVGECPGNRRLSVRAARCAGDHAGRATSRHHVTAWTHRPTRRATPRDAPLAIGLTPLPSDARLPGPGRPPVRRRPDKAARTLAGTLAGECRRVRVAIDSTPAHGLMGVSPERCMDSSRRVLGCGAVP